MDSILKSMGVDQYEPKVINQLLEFMHKYVRDILQDAIEYKEHAHKNEVDVSDVRLATSGKLSFCFTHPPPREVLLGLATARNEVPLPVIGERFGILLPPEKYCLTAQNFTIDPEVRNDVDVGADEERE
jgi:transcription initiation factor TFIID subunit 9B